MDVDEDKVLNPETRLVETAPRLAMTPKSQPKPEARRKKGHKTRDTRKLLT